MKAAYPKLGIQALCGLFGKTRHAYYDALYRGQKDELKDDLILELVKEIRKDLPRLGTRKLYDKLQIPLLEHKLDVGRDYLFNLLKNHQLLIRSRKRKAITTDSRHWMRKYSNLIEGLVVTRANQVWVSDITYIRFLNGFLYLALITDAYSRKIVGYSLRRDLSAEGCLNALKMALKNRTTFNGSLIHHSDRGSQYCCKAYVDLLTENNMAISMTNNGDPYENAIAERVNGILKQEFNLYSSQQSMEATCTRVEKSINAYNQIRPHASCDYLTPNLAHLKEGVLVKRWKNYYKPNLLTHKFEKKEPV